MAEVEEECTFYTRADQVQFDTQNADNTAELEFQVKVRRRNGCVI